MFRKQLIAFAGAVPALVAVLLVWRYTPQLFAHVTLPADDAADRLAFAVHWLLLPGLTLLAGIVVAGRRGFVKGAIEGTRTPDNYNLEINLRYNTNTLEQTVLAAFAWLGLSLALPVGELIVIPAMAVLFTVGRVTFWLGYMLHPLARTFGMVMTVLPTLAAYGWLSWQVFGKA